MPTQPDQVAAKIARHESKRRAGTAGPYCDLDWEIHLRDPWGAHGAHLAERKAFNTAIAGARRRQLELRKVYQS